MHNRSLFEIDDDRNEAQIVMTDLFVILFLVALFLMGEDLVTLPTPQASDTSEQPTATDSIRIFVHEDGRITLDAIDGEQISLEILPSRLDSVGSEVVILFAYDVPGGVLYEVQAAFHASQVKVVGQAVLAE